MKVAGPNGAVQPNRPLAFGCMKGDVLKHDDRPSDAAWVPEDFDMKIVGAAEFKKNVSRILDELEATGEPVTITKTGEASTGAATPAEPLPPLFGLLKSDLYSFPDPFSPLEDQWEEAFLRKWDDKLL